MANKQKSSTQKAKSEKSGIRLFYFSDNLKGQQEMAKTMAIVKDEDIPRIVPTKKIRLEHLKKITPMTFSQTRMFEQYDEGYNLVCHGMAGVGKTFIACYLALREILMRESQYERLVIVRSAVPVRDVGFLPGSVQEKIEVYQQPYKAIFKELFLTVESPEEKLFEQKLYQFVPTSFIRGITLHKSIVIVDEAQDLTFHEADSVITRLGEDCKIVFCGDKTQTDLTKKEDKEGFSKFLSILNKIPEFRSIQFTEDDIVRSKLVKQYLITKHQMGY